MKQQKFMVRQGDVLIRAVDAIPSNAKPKAPSENGHVLAFGEKTGHMHRFKPSKNVRAFERRSDDGQSRMFLELLADAELRHDTASGGGTGEHAPIVLPPGCYEVKIQREYTPEGDRRVQD